MATKETIKALLFGFSLGSLAGVLLAPKSGSQTRDDLKKTYERTKNQVLNKLSRFDQLSQEKYSEIVAKVVSEYEQVEQLTQDQRQKLEKLLRSKWDEARFDRE